MKELRVLTLKCKDASRLISDGMDRKLSILERLGLRLHLLICAGCRAFRRQLQLIRRVIRTEMDSNENDATGARLAIPMPESQLSPEARERIAAALRGDS